MFSISLLGLFWGTRAIIGEFHAIIEEQYTQQVFVPSAGWVLFECCLKVELAYWQLTLKKQQEREETVGTAVCGSHCFSSSPPSLSLSLAFCCMLSCWMLSPDLCYSLTNASSELLWPVTGLMCNMMWIHPHTPLHPHSARSSNLSFRLSDSLYPPSSLFHSPGAAENARCV